MKRKTRPPSVEVVKQWENALEEILQAKALDPKAKVDGRLQRPVDQGNELGKYAEQRFISVMSDKQSTWPSWLAGVHKATFRQNLLEMTDAFVTTTWGPAPIQIKHSEREARRYKRKNVNHRSAYRRQRLNEIILIVVNKEKTDQEIYDETLALVQAKFATAPAV